MCGVIVVDAGRSRSTNLGRDAYILTIAMDIIIIIWGSINCRTVICLPTMCYFSREATSEIYRPRVYSLSYLLWDLFSFAFVSRSIIPKKNYWNILFHIYQDLFIQSITILSRQFDNFRCCYLKKGLTTPYTRRVASICSLCACTIYWIDTLVS